MMSNLGRRLGINASLCVALLLAQIFPPTQGHPATASDDVNDVNDVARGEGTAAEQQLRARVAAVGLCTLNSVDR
jgi:hypothetical protein